MHRSRRESLDWAVHVVISRNMEIPLFVRINKKMANDRVSEAIICEKANNCLKNLVLRLLLQVPVLWRSFLAPSDGLLEWGKGLNYTAWWGMVRLVVETGTLLSNIVRNKKKVIEEGGSISHFWRVKKSGIKQSNLDSFFKKIDKRPPADEPLTGQSRKLSRNDDSSPSTSMRYFMIFIRKFCFFFTG